MITLQFKGTLLDLTRKSVLLESPRSTIRKEFYDRNEPFFFHPFSFLSLLASKQTYLIRRSIYTYIRALYIAQPEILSVQCKTHTYIRINSHAKDSRVWLSTKGIQRHNLRCTMVEKLRGRYIRKSSARDGIDFVQSKAGRRHCALTSMQPTYPSLHHALVLGASSRDPTSASSHGGCARTRLAYISTTGAYTRRLPRENSEQIQ